MRRRLSRSSLASPAAWHQGLGSGMAAHGSACWHRLRGRQGRAHGTIGKLLRRADAREGLDDVLVERIILAAMADRRLHGAGARKPAKTRELHRMHAHASISTAYWASFWARLLTGMLAPAVKAQEHTGEPALVTEIACRTIAPGPRVTQENRRAAASIVATTMPQRWHPQTQRSPPPAAAPLQL